ncbi:MAG TPA: hypothetical protein VFP86_21730 [bacterium]|nr:hypothetical protein [bacterium]
MPTRKRPRTRTRESAPSRPPRGPRDPRSVIPELRDVRKNQVQTGDELRDANVPIATEPAFVFQP